MGPITGGQRGHISRDGKYFGCRVASGVSGRNLGPVFSYGVPALYTYFDEKLVDSVDTTFAHWFRGDWELVTCVATAPYFRVFSWNSGSGYWQYDSSFTNTRFPTQPAFAVRDAVLTADLSRLIVSGGNMVNPLRCYTFSVNAYIEGALPTPQPTGAELAHDNGMAVSASGDVLVVNYNTKTVSYHWDGAQARYIRGNDVFGAYSNARACDVSDDGSKLVIAGFYGLRSFTWNSATNRYEFDGAIPTYDTRRAMCCSMAADGSYFVAGFDAASPTFGLFRWSAALGRYEYDAEGLPTPPNPGMGTVVRIAKNTGRLVLGHNYGSAPHTRSYSYNPTTSEYSITPLASGVALPTNATALGTATRDAQALATSDLSAIWTLTP
jgi:hypothetical protein